MLSALWVLILLGGAMLFPLPMDAEEAQEAVDIAPVEAMVSFSMTTPPYLFQNTVMHLLPPEPAFIIEDAPYPFQNTVMH